jgi:hypothetical protein
MFNSEATIDRTQDQFFAAFEGPIVRGTADSAQVEDDEALMDAFLASLAPQEFETFLSRLAEIDSREIAFLEPTA